MRDNGHRAPASISILPDNDSFSLEGKEILPKDLGLRASLNRTLGSEILKQGRCGIWEEEYLISRVFRLAGAVSC